jgi:FlaA1/EpsC-like NDP-sugar epimerase
MGYDLFVLSIISILVNYWFQIVDDSNSLLLFLGGVLIPSLIIIIFKNYKIIWSRARPWQFWKLYLELVLSEFLYFLLITYLVGLEEINLLHFHVTRLAFLLGAIVIARVTPVIARDASSWLRRYQTNETHFKTLIIGSGYELGAYLRRAAYRNSHIITRKIIGILEDDPSLADTTVFGFPVLGEYKDFENVLDNSDITEVIICDPEFYEKSQNNLKRAKDMKITIKRYVSDVEEM